MRAPYYYFHGCCRLLCTPLRVVLTLGSDFQLLEGGPPSLDGFDETPFSQGLD